mgnify:CR=1 FL=1|tara:strand:- start:1092 stop:1244 length:153 start_codon:yes stop_codon:yes gene_type:complete
MNEKKDYDGPLYAPWYKVEEFRKTSHRYADHVTGKTPYPPAFKRDSKLSD